jgi:hypothetical protein
VKVYFACPNCETAARLGPPLPADWQCPACDRLTPLRPPEADGKLRACLVCGNGELYRKKDFPHALGMAILTVACLASAVTYALYYQWLTWAILIGSALFDGLLYLWVGDVVVCYRCGAQFRNLGSEKKFAPFELGTAERYRQERLRREQLNQG